MKHYLASKSEISGTIEVPASKSESIRSILFASLANGISQIDNLLDSPDTHAMIEACKQLGAQFEHHSKSQLQITGVAGKPTLPDDVIYAGNSGLVLRFITGIAGLIKGTTVITGDESIRHRRPMQPLIDGLNQLGAECISTKSDGHAPIVIKGPIQHGTTALTGEDSQPVSSLIIAACFLRGDTHIKVSNAGEKPWIDLTLNWLKRFHIEYHNENYQHYSIRGSENIEPFMYTVPGDWSSAAFPIAAALISKGKLILHGLSRNEPQGDKALIDALLQMGANITVESNQLIIVGNRKLTGITLDINHMIDALPILAVIATQAQSPTQLVNAQIARNKESDRISAISNELKKMGAQIETSDDSITIFPSPLTAATVDSHQDHRIAMALTIAGLLTDKTTKINNVSCIDKTYQNFFHTFKSLGANITECT